MEIINGDIRNTKYLIVQQGNCRTKSVHGLSQILRDCYGADPYKGRTIPSILGTLHIHPQVITLYAQYYPGKPGIWGRRYDRDNVVPDTAVIRETAFKT